VQLSELLSIEVVDTTAQRIGTVVDVRLVVSGALDDSPSAPTLFGLVISPRTTSSYLGYERSDARRPALLSALLRWRHRNAFLALWSDIERIDAQSVTLRAGFSRYSPILRDDD
jgi:hypothetical protein